ncbi:alpha/beta fold hydrolase [Streptomyces sp. NPDC057474]|uniref:alpha/beta fold hydrolase n=1 Tax=Streptomyces sp. NPDC057474 TaxID=3346144 RepID=UPI00368402C2
MSTETAKAPSWAYYTQPEFVEVGGLSTAYRRKGQGERVVYLHSDGLTRAWLPFFEKLSGAVDCVVPEHPGYGETPINDEIQSFEDLVLHYDGLLDALGLEPVHLVGHGLGGWLAADLAVFYPRRFKSLTLITPTGLRLPDVPSIDTFRMLPEERLSALLNGREAAYAEYFEQEGDPDDMIRAMVESAATARLMWNPRYDHRLDHRLRRVSTPTLVIGAQEDRVVPTAMAGRYAELIPDARLITFEGPTGQSSGHLPHLEHPAEISGLVTQHVAANT